MKHCYLPLACLCLLVFFCLPSTAQIRGKAFLDENANGLLDYPGEKGMPNLRIRAYDRLGVILASTITDSLGYYKLPLLPAQPMRIQFEELPAGYSPSKGQFVNRFITSQTAVFNLGLYQPSSFLGASPRLAISIQPLGSHADGRDSSLGVTTVRLMPATLVQPDSVTTLVQPAATGSIWGLAYDRNSHRLFSSALAKRHSGFGPLGSGGIYLTDLVANLTQPFVSLDALGVPTAPPMLKRDLSPTYEGRMLDSLMFAQVGKMGLGGIDLSEDGSTLYTLNLYDRKLYGLKLSRQPRTLTANDLTVLPVPTTGCQGGAFRPFAVKFHQGKVYVGGVCDAQQSGKVSDLQAYVYAIDPETRNAQQVVALPLDYPRGTVEYGIGNWFAWTDDPQRVMLKEPAWWAIHPQPILSDLEFDTDGSLLLGLMDRLGHQMATGKGTADGRWQQSVSIAAGDVLRASPKRKRFQLEANARVGDRQSAGEGNAQGPQGGEFYNDDSFSMDGVQYHQENGMGGLALLPGRGQVLVSSREPLAEYNSAGVSAYDNQSGKQVGGMLAYHHNPAVEFVGRKTNHVGDIEVIGALPPTYLGHRVWQDCNEDGMQDADEPGLGGVAVELWQQGRRLAQTTTDSSGLYSFGSSQLAGGIEANSTYELRVAYQQPPYGRLSLVMPATSADKRINSDALTEEHYAVIRFNTGEAGANQLALDFGFRCVTRPQANATISCTGSEWSNAKILVSLTGYKADERFELTQSPSYSGRASYESASIIPAQGLIFSQPLLALSESDLSIRLFKPGGCYQDLWVNVSQSASCVQLLTQPSGDEQAGLEVWPNSTRDKVQLRFRGSSTEAVTLQVFNSNSRRLQQEVLSPSADGSYQSTLDLSRQSPGLYIVSVQQGSRLVSRRVIRQ